MPAFSADDLSQHVASLRALARDLLADAHLAEDAVQQACVAALARPTAAKAGLGAWLRAAVRSCALDLWRSESRRRAREHAAARPLAHEERDAAEQLELHEDIAAAVRSLDEPYRTAVWLRYYEHRTPREIAQLLGAPVKTVKTRLSRALEMLRQKLDGRYGDRKTRLGVLVPFVSPPRAVTVAVLGGGVFMQGKPMLLAGVVLLLAVAGTIVAWPRDDAAAAPPAHPAQVANVTAQQRAEPPPTAMSPAREAVPPSVSPYGSLVVRVQWHDRTPAPGIAIHCDVAGEPQLDRNEMRLVADANGIARAPHVHAGKLRLTSDRGGTSTATLPAGGTCEVEFMMPRGIDVAGTVVDEHERPVASADVVLVSPRGGWLGGRTLATSDGSGAFTLRSVDAKWSLGARAAGHAPSELVDLEQVARAPEATSVHVQLRLLQAGATVVGKVVDATGGAIAGATVVLGRNGGGHYEPPRIRESWSPHVVESGADGSFRCEGVAPGEQPIDARAEGCTRATASVTCVAGATAEVTLVLARGFVVRGTVRDDNGAAVVDAVVAMLDPNSTDESFEGTLIDTRLLKRPRTRSDATGRFELRSVPEGTATLLAATQDGKSSYYITSECQTTLTGRAGDELTWDPVLRAGKTLRVRLVDEHGKPARYGAMLRAYAEQPAGLSTSRSASANFDAPGLYVFTQCADVPYTVEARVGYSVARETQWVYVRGAMPGGPDVELRVPAEPEFEATEITGRIVDTGNRFAGRSPDVSLGGWGVQVHTRPDGDRFVTKDAPPGRYQVVVKIDDQPVLVGEPFEVASGQRLDLGDLATTRGATLRVALRTRDGASIDKPAAYLGERWSQSRMKWDGTHLLGANVTAGRHRVRLVTPGWYAPTREFDLEAGQDLVVVLDVVPATLRRLRFTMPFPDQWQRCEFRLRDVAGFVVAVDRSNASGCGIAPHWWIAQLPFGQFTLEAELDGVRREWPVDLRDTGNAATPLRFSLR